MGFSPCPAICTDPVGVDTTSAAQSRAIPAAPCRCRGVTLAMEGCRISPSTPWRQLQLPAQVEVGSMNPGQQYLFRQGCYLSHHYSNCNFYCTKSFMATEVMTGPAGPSSPIYPCSLRRATESHFLSPQPDFNHLSPQGPDC